MNEKTKEKHKIDEFEQHIHLWNLVPGGSGKGIVLLRKIVDTIQNENYSDPGNNLPSFLITGTTGKKIVARALVNSLAIEDIRVCPGKYFENGIMAYQFFWNSLVGTAHIITDIEQLQEKAESTLWKYLKNRKCSYYNHLNRAYDNIIFCNGVIVMTTSDGDLVSENILKATDNIIELEEMNLDRLEAIIHQRLVFCGVEYEGDEVLRAIIDIGKGKIDLIILFLKKCLMYMNSEMVEFLDMGVVRKVKGLGGMAVEPWDDIPF